VEIVQSVLGTFYLEDDGTWYRSAVGTDKRGRPWSRRKANAGHILIAPRLLQAQKDGRLQDEEQKIIAERKVAMAARVPGGWNREIPLSEEQRAALSSAAKLRTGEKNPFFGKTHTQETRDKIAEARHNHTGWHHSDATKEKMRVAWETRRSTPISDETRARISVAQTGRECTPGTREKLSASMKVEMERRARGRKASYTVSTETRQRMSDSYLESVTTKRRAYLASIPVTKVVGSAHIGCRGTLEEATTRILEADPEVASYEYEPVVIRYQDGDLEHNCLPDYLVTFKDGSRALIEVNAPGLTHLEQRHARAVAIRNYCKEQGYQFWRWSRYFVARRCSLLGIAPPLPSKSAVRASYPSSTPDASKPTT
jgi:hypothetical protein